MRLLVLSDSHGDLISLKMAIESTPDADVIVFLGDGASDFTKLSQIYSYKTMIAVKGNCDGQLCIYPERALEKFANALVYCTHGYVEHVKFGLSELKAKAREYEANIALYGHTHIPHVSYDDGLHIMNPGSARENSCGIVDITSNGILCFTKKIVQ